MRSNQPELRCVDAIHVHILSLQNKPYEIGSSSDKASNTSNASNATAAVAAAGASFALIAGLLATTYKGALLLRNMSCVLSIHPGFHCRSMLQDDDFHMQLSTMLNCNNILSMNQEFLLQAPTTAGLFPPTERHASPGSPAQSGRFRSP